MPDAKRPIMSTMKKLPLLGNITAEEFLQTYWHKKPLLIRQAIPGFTPVLPRDALLSLAASDEVESRLIMGEGANWELRHGPFDQLPSVSKKDWTILLQGMNLHNDDADALMQQFRFIPDTRLDDLMISYATEGGGVGPHFDSYDVFLLQAHGKRHWKIGPQKDLTLIEGMPLKILKNFRPTQEYVLEPGDMLYLPPHYAHDGIAVDGECMTYSIGFRAPTYQELGEEFLNFMTESIDLPGRYADPDLQATTHPAMLQQGMIDSLSEQLEKIRFTDDDITIFLGRYMSEPKNNVYFDVPEKPLTMSRFLQAADKKGIRLSSRTRMLYQKRNLFINGESFTMKRVDIKALVHIADERQLPPELVASASDDVREALYQWYRDGWVVLAQQKV